MNTEKPPDGSSRSESSNHLYQLPNGMSVYHVNKHETDFLYKEIFVDRAYLRYGITLHPNACIFDIGANIGLFSLFIKAECADAQVYAFEPIPDLARILKLNTREHGQSVKVYQNGVADSERVAVFTYYPDYSILSGLHPDACADGNVLASGVRHQLAESRAKIVDAPDEYIDLLVQKKLGKRTEIECRLKTVSGIIHETQVKQIDLLKIDAEKSELAILRGIQESDWPIIKQLALEVHSMMELEVVIPMLESKGFEIKIEQESQFKNADVFNCFARRKKVQI